MAERPDRRGPAFWSYILISLVIVALGAVVVWRGWPDQMREGPSRRPVKAEQPPAATQTAPADAPSADEAHTIDVVKRVGPAVVMINTRVQKVVLDYFRRPVVQQAEGLGSGFIMNKDGYVLTNNHVISDAQSILVTLPGKNPVSGKLVGGDAVNDLAVIKIPGRSDLPVAPLGDSRKLQVGQAVVAIGNPYGFDNTVTTGVVSALGRSLPTEADPRLELQELIQTDASINPGNSGGPLLNLAGEVVGINTAIISQAQGLGFAIPIHVAREIADDLITHGKVLRLGIIGETISPAIADQLEAQTGRRLPVDHGVLVVSVEAKSPANTAGVRQGDILVELNGQTVDQVEDIRPMVRKIGFGGQIVLTVLRAGQRLRLRSVLG